MSLKIGQEVTVKECEYSDLNGAKLKVAYVGPAQPLMIPYLDWESWSEDGVLPDEFVVFEISGGIDFLPMDEFVRVTRCFSKGNRRV